MIIPQVPIDPERLDMCFGCGPNNPIGLKLNFQQEGKTVRAEFTPTELHQGWSGITHGGIIHTLLDEAMSYAAAFAGAVCVTAAMQARWKRTAPIGEPLIITSSITKNSRRLIETEASITLKDGSLVATGTATMYVVGRKDHVV